MKWIWEIVGIVLFILGIRIISYQTTFLVGFVGGFSLMLGLYLIIDGRIDRR